MRIVRHTRFEKKLARLPKKIRGAIADRTALFLQDQRHPLLNTHPLTGDREGQYSFNITGDWRLIYIPIDAETLLFLEVDTHHNLYGT